MLGVSVYYSFIIFVCFHECCNLKTEALSSQPQRIAAATNPLPPSPSSTFKSESKEEKRKAKLFLNWFENSYHEVPHPGKKLTLEWKNNNKQNNRKFISKIQGTLIRNGPAVFTAGNRYYKHIFDGIAKLQSFEFCPADEDEISIVFRTKFIETLWKKFLVDYNFLPPSITTGPVGPEDWNTFESVLGLAIGGIVFDNAPVNVEKLSDDTYVAVTDAPVQVEFDAATLETIGTKKYPNGGSIEGFKVGGLPLFSTAHPKRWRGLIHNYVLEISPSSDAVAHIVRTNKDLSRKSVGSIGLSKSSIPYIHDISVTENYAVLCVYPLTIPGIETFTKGAFLPQQQFDASSRTKIYIFSLTDDLMTEPVASFETDPFFAYHHVNAYEDSENIVLDVLAYENGNMVNGEHGFLYISNMKDPETRGKQEREASVWRINMNLSYNGYGTQKPYYVPVEKKILHDSLSKKIFGMELATVSPEVLGKKYRYCYGFNGFHQGEGGFLNWCLVKQDVEGDENEDRTAVWFEEFSYPSEPVFVADPDAANEDGGALLSVVYDSKRNENYLLILNAQNMEEIARAYTGVRSPPQFHGKFFPKD